MERKEQQLIDERWDKKHEKQLEEALAGNEELRKLFKKSPEKKEEYKLKIIEGETVHYPTPPDDILCKNCKFQLQPISVGGKETSRFNWSKCRIIDNKPYEVLYEGARCEFYEKQ